MPKFAFQLKSMAARLVRSMPIQSVSAASAAVLAGLAVSGCSIFTGDSTAFVGECLSDRLDIVESADWSGVQPVRLRIVDGSVRPMVLYLEKDRPYILTIENADRTSHSIWAPRLFKQAVALESVQMGDKAPVKGCVNGARVEQGSEVTLRFVPVWEGRYEMYDSALSMIPGQRADGVVNIVPQRVGLAAK